jgi:hypothetical protein
MWASCSLLRETYGQQQFSSLAGAPAKIAAKNRQKIFAADRRFLTAIFACDLPCAEGANCVGTHEII